MAWILLEGLDRSGKSTVAQMYKDQGYDVVHMSAPDKKYMQPGYSGPSYLEELVDMYSIYEGKNVVFDRTPYGEKIWPEVYNRQPLLNNEDLEYLQSLEYNNDAIKIIMYDSNVEEHWQRCVDNKEPLTRLQFVQASRLYDSLADQYNFQKKQLPDVEKADEDRKETEVQPSPENSPQEFHNDNAEAGALGQSGLSERQDSDRSNSMDLEQRLERANAIRSLLKSPLIKKKGEVFKSIESDIKEFLESELEGLFTDKPKKGFTDEEITILKIYASRIMEKLG